MSSRRRASEESAASESRGSSLERTPPAPRQTSVRLTAGSGERSGRSGGSQVGRVTLARSNGSGATVSAVRHRSGRTPRRPTPVVRRSRTRRDDTSADAEERASVTELSDAADEQSGRRSRRGGSGRTRYGASVTLQSGESADSTRLTWYDRMMPDFLLNLTAPITGYESRLDSDIDDEEYEILERQRLKRNRRVRRRLLALILIATATTAFLYSRGRIFRRAGVKAAASTLKQRIEGGLARSIQETMGK